MAARQLRKNGTRGTGQTVSRSPSRSGSIQPAIAVGIAVFMLLVVSAPSIGVTWDEPVYIATAKSYIGWFPVLVTDPGEALSRAGIDAYWSRVHEHPPGERIMSGLMWLVARHGFDDLLAIRFGPMLLAAGLAALVYSLVTDCYGRPAGAYATLALLSMPRFFFHSHLAAQDVPVAAASFTVVFVFWKTVDRPGWFVGFLWGAAWGLALLFKVSAIVVPVGLAIWCLIFRPRWTIAGRLFIMGIAGAVTFVLLWPWLYYDTLPRLLEYMNRFLQFGPLGVWYAGRYFALAPWHFGPAIIWAVVPPTTLALFLFGASRAGSGQGDGGLIWLLLTSGLVSIAPFVRDGSLVFDNDRFFMPIFPYVAAVAGIGFGHILALLKKWAARVEKTSWFIHMAALLGLTLLAPQIVNMARLFPHLLSYYSEGVGGLRGATRLGFETTYWCEAYSDALPYINEHASPGDKIWVETGSQDVLVYYQSIGRLRADVIVSFDQEFPREVDWYIYQHRQSQARGAPDEDYPPRASLKFEEPVHELRFDGVPILSLYGRFD